MRGCRKRSSVVVVVVVKVLLLLLLWWWSSSLSLSLSLLLLLPSNLKPPRCSLLQTYHAGVVLVKMSAFPAVFL